MRNIINMRININSDDDTKSVIEILEEIDYNELDHEIQKHLDIVGRYTFHGRKAYIDVDYYDEKECESHVDSFVNVLKSYRRDKELNKLICYQIKI